MPLHVHALAAERDAFHAEAQALFGSSFEGKFDLAAGTQDTVPGKPAGWFGA